MEPDPVEQFYSFVPDNFAVEMGENLQESAVFRELGTPTVESCSRPAAMRKRINALPKTSTPFQNGSNISTKIIFSSNRRHSTGMTCESLSEEGSSDDEAAVSLVFFF